ncbi:RRT14 [Candida oxycetoniae]|uniref:Regulator of rDNA transcription 14 n=1 Tax=Candida oxycetoniae TaxID=497107 RepID=A0AAI9STS6_9ASCO|nr:RRT14 [Candida oxycetoniae]KAI3402503.2 RRT14 [Candida oxycetoniae]
MPFISQSSKSQAESTISKMFSDLLPSSTKTNAKPKAKANSSSSSLSATQILSQQLQSQPNFTPKAIKKNRSTLKKQQKKKQKQDQRFQKFIKYNMIKSKSINNPDKLTVEEGNYLKKLTKRNINELQKLNTIDDFEINEEMNSVKQDLLKDLAPAKNKQRLRKKLLIANNSKGKNSDDFGDFIDFDAKVKKGWISVPGLTPGLAPIDYDEEDDST